MNMSWWRSNGGVWRLLFILFLGQVVSFLLELAAFSSSLVANLGVETPLFLSFFPYLILTLAFGSILLHRRQKLLVPWYWYMALAFINVHGSYAFNKAYQFTSITSITLLDCWTIVWVIGLTWYFIGTRYSTWQLLGVAVCVFGLGLVLLSDSGVAGGGGSRPFLGDMIVIAGTFCDAISDVSEEFCIKNKDLVEVVSMVSLFGALISACEVAVLERNSVQSVKWTNEIVLAFAGYAFAVFSFSVLVPFILKMSGATMFNLSLLTSDMWAVIIKIFFYNQQVNWLYYVSFAIVGIGLVIYSKNVKESDSEPAHKNKDSNERCKLLKEEFIASRNNDVLA